MLQYVELPTQAGHHLKKLKVGRTELNVADRKYDVIVCEIWGYHCGAEDPGFLGRDCVSFDD